MANICEKCTHRNVCRYQEPCEECNQFQEEVVRCKDCKHWKPSGSMAGNTEDDLQPIGGCEWANCCRKANDFCSYGERREGE